MKISLKILISFFFSICLVSAQEKKSNLEVTYYLKLQSDSLNNNNFLETEMVLLCNNNTSSYFNPNLVNYYEYLDIQIKSATNPQEIANNYRPIPKIRHNVWKENNQIFITMPLGKYNYTYKSENISWKLLAETKKIENYVCNLAETKIDNNLFYAWYTPQIPIQEGPFKFKGLPGLILEIYNKNHTINISATKIEGKKIEIIKINNPLNVKLKNRDEYLAIRERFLKYPFEKNISKEIEKKRLEAISKINIFLD
jgi:GLPGLI family protein